MLRFRSAGLCLAAMMALGGCPEDAQSFRLQLKLVPDLHLGNDRCSAAPSTNPLPLGNYHLRVTFMRREAVTRPDSLRKYDLVCDRMYKPSTGALTDLLVPDKDPRLTIRVEAFTQVSAPQPGGPAYQLAYAGQLEGVDLSGAGATVSLRAAAGLEQQSSTAGFQSKLSCVPVAKSPRAFHTATLLPNGQVLVLGGVAKRNENEMDAVKETEYYDPATNEFVALQDSIAPRAFHQAFLLTSPTAGPYRILLVGGVQPSAAKPAFLRRTATAQPFLLTPQQDVTAAPTQIVSFSPASGGQPARLTVSPKAPDLAPLMFPSAELDGKNRVITVAAGAAGQLVGGGFSDPSPKVYRLKIADNPNDDPTVETAVLHRIHVGHAVARLGGDRYLVLGGRMDGPQEADATKLTEQAELASFAGSPSVTTAAFLPAGTVPDLTAWHTLTPMGEDATGSPAALLWAGGFSLKYQSATLRIADRAPRAQALQWMGVSDLKLADVPSSGSGFVAAGYHEATPLADSGVLLSGGNGGTCGQDAVCPLGQLVIYDYHTGGPMLRGDAGSPQLRPARFGHRATLLLDGTVLITGGISKPAGTEYQIESETAIYSPRTAASSDDPFLRGPGTTLRSCRLSGVTDPDGSTASHDGSAPSLDQAARTDRGAADRGAASDGGMTSDRGTSGS